MEWIAFHSLEPWGEERADLRAAIVASTIANVNRAKGQPAFKVADFMPEFDRAARRQTPEQMQMILRSMAGVLQQREQRKNG